MIFRRSLSKKKGAAYSFFSGLSAGFVPAVLIMLLQTLLMAVLPLLEFISIDFGKNDTAGEIILSKDKYKFLTYGLTNSSELFLIFAVLGILAILVAVRLFSFICDKKTVNVFYSLGIKRSTLFMSKYLSGAVLLICATAIPVILSYIVNIIFLGGSWQLSIVLLHLYCGLSVFALLCFSAAAVVFSSVGTVSEAVVYSAALLFAPTIIIFLTEQIIGAFLPSSTINDYIVLFEASQHDYYGDTSASLLERSSDYNPLLFFANELTAFSRGLLEKGEIQLSIDGEAAAWYTPKLFIHFPWFIIATGLGVLGALLFRRIKAENCGFLNTNKVLSNLAIFELCLVGSSIMLGEIQWSETWVVIAGGIAAAFGLYLLAEIFLKRNFLKILKALYKFVAHMGVIAIIYGVCATGLFGYGNYIPDKSKIQSVSISVPFSYSQITTEYADYNWNTDGFMYLFEKAYSHTMLPEMTDSADIDKVMEINRLAVSTEKDEGYHSEIIIRYNLKNGGISERKHILTSRAETEKIMELINTTAYKNTLYNLFYNNFSEKDLKAEYNQYGWIENASFMQLAFSYKYSVVTARSNSLAENRALKLTEAQFNTLKDAIYKDLSTETPESYFLSNKAQLGVLSLGVSDDVYRIEGINQDYYLEEDMTIGSSTIIIAPENEDIFPEDITTDEVFPDKGTEEEIPEDKYLYTDNMVYNDLGGMRNSGTYDIIITEDMANTLSALNSFGYADCFRSELTIESVSFREYAPDKIFNYYRDNTRNYILDFFAYTADEYIFNEHENGQNPEDQISENKITDKTRLQELDSLMKLHEYTFNDGYFCLVKYSDGTYTVKYLSREDAPDYVNSFNYVMNGQDGFMYW